ncbi:threonine-phosphate decarboxylase CobD [Thermanaeromonas sp. C210]|uniref:threonine-phosphate decarboxylase CobD n=1 Tax=Thermanaeromonas sp. C210 TaxID=2731925 RepID=UPI001565B61A|nr:threonine-phosphate decarboxylase CobD [Thermanaeromonas sp. C210]
MVERQRGVEDGVPSGPLHGGDWRGALDKYGWKPEEILDFSANINPLGPPAGVWACLTANLRAVCRYPDPASKELKEALSLELQVPPGALLIGNGATDIIYSLCFLLKPRAVLVAEPTFAEYRRAAEAAGARVLSLPLPAGEGFRLDGAEYSRCLARVDMAFLCNPNNPVGNLIEDRDLAAVLEESRRQGTWLVVDESFLDFVQEDRRRSLCREALRYPNVVVLRSLTKFYALPGLRLGYAVASPSLIRHLEGRRDPWSVNILAQMAGVEALKDREFVVNTRKWLEEEKEYLYRGLASLSGSRPYPPEANFILVDIGRTGWSSGRLAEACARRKVLVRDCASFAGLGDVHIRVAVRDRQANNILLAVLRELLSGGCP